VFIYFSEIFNDMDAMWEYNAPQYVDFTKRLDDDRADTYFGMFASVHQLQTTCHLRADDKRENAKFGKCKSHEN